MTTFTIIVIISALIFGFVLLLWSAQPKKYYRLSRNDLQKHIKSYCETHEQNGFIEILPNFTQGIITIKRKNFKTKSDILELKITSGNNSRAIVQEIHNLISNLHYDLKVTYTKKKKLIQHLILKYQIDDVFTPTNILNTIDHIVLAYKNNNEPEFQITEWGPLINNRNNDSAFYKAGLFFGFLAGRIFRFLNKIVL